MNEKEIDYNLLEVEKGNKRYGIYLKNHIQDQHNRIHDLLKDNTEYKLENERLNNIINELEEEMKIIIKEYERYTRYDIEDIRDLTVAYWYGYSDSADNVLCILKGLKENK